MTQDQIILVIFLKASHILHREDLGRHAQALVIVLQTSRICGCSTRRPRHECEAGDSGTFHERVERQRVTWNPDWEESIRRLSASYASAQCLKRHGNLNWHRPIFKSCRTEDFVSKIFLPIRVSRKSGKSWHGIFGTLSDERLSLIECNLFPLYLRSSNDLPFPPSHASWS